MEPFVKITGTVVPLDRVDIDTDQIIPKQFLKRIERSGFGRYLFYDWRFDENGKLNPDFELNRIEYQGASILVARRNFGSGSSREHAPWALLDYGFRCIVAPSFADIFQKNCFENGLIPVLLSDDHVQYIISRSLGNVGYSLTIDLEESKVTDEFGLDVSFNVHKDSETNEFRRYCLLNGLDDIGLILQHEEKIGLYESKNKLNNLDIT